jgi:predicted RNase H-like HicB family nuclease
MKYLDAKRVKIKIGDMWESPLLHVLLSVEDGVVVARCLDFTVSSHGEHEEEAIASLAEAIKEYVLTAIENGTIQLLYDPSRGKYWRAFKEIEKKRSIALLNQSLKTSMDNDYLQAINQTTPELIYV